jgi:ATP-binding cassette subfamily B protein
LRANAETVWLMSVYGPGVEMLGQLGVFLVLLVGGYRAFGGHITVGVLAAFLLYLRQFFDPLQELSEFFNSLQAANAGLEKIAGVLRVSSTVPEAPDAQAFAPRSAGIAGAEVRLDRVTFAYQREPVLHDVDLTIAPGETLALVGATGAGKSTIAKLVARFYDPTEGRVLVDGHDLRSVSAESLRSQLGIVPQEGFLFSGTVRDNISFGRPAASQEDIAAAARAVGADTFISALDHGYDTQVGERGVQLSAGQRQLIAFARALVADPRILVLDEATSNVDVHTETLIENGLRRLVAGRTAIVIAHRLSTIRGAGRIVVLEHGGIVEQGTHDELLDAGGRYWDLYRDWAEQAAA